MTVISSKLLISGPGLRSIPLMNRAIIISRRVRVLSYEKTDRLVLLYDEMGRLRLRRTDKLGYLRNDFVDDFVNNLVSLPDPTSYNVRVVFVNDFVNKPPKPVVITNVFVINFVNKPPPLRPWQQTLKLTDNALKRTLKLTDNAMKWDRNVFVNDFVNDVANNFVNDIANDFVNDIANDFDKPGGGGAP